MIDSKQEIFLVLRSQTGDREAFDKLLKSIQQPLFRYIFRLTGNAALAEDILQDVFLIIYRKIRWLEEPKVFRPWAYRIASRKTFWYLKKEKSWTEQVREEAVLEKIQREEQEHIYEPELIEKIPALLSQLSPAARAVVVLHYLEEMSLSEAAAILEIPLGTAKSRLAYGLENLRKNFKKYENA
jgi:RNA polymerase sigma-70 factor, ECF subfamily